jgi:DNA replication and repair protein RecF
MEDLAQEGFALEYRRGWKLGETLANALTNAWRRDRETGITSVGPHRAELRICLGGRLAKRIVSRGQGKLVLVGMAVAQIKFIASELRTEPVVLVDDLASELDEKSRSWAARRLCDTSAQIFFTCIEPGMLHEVLARKPRMFHVEQGEVRLK